jgi:calcium/calmodulin-dependent protein kinase I
MSSAEIAKLLGLGGKKKSRASSSHADSPPPPEAILTENRDVHTVYSIGKTLGSGAFSVVKLGTHRITGNTFAVKIIDKRKGKMSAENLEKELSIFKRVDHPHVVRFQELFETEDKIYIVTELLTGGELLDRVINNGNFSEQDAARITLHLAEAIDYLHLQGIVHRDLKPENILLASEDGDAPIKISDFGLSAMAEKDAAGKDFMMKTSCGTLHYAAPEVLLRKGYDKRVGG